MTAARLDPALPLPPRWAVRAAHAAALVTLPSGIWRLLLAAGFAARYTQAGYEAMGFTGWGAVYVVGLSMAGELLALLTLGLVRPWGEVLPRWVPLAGGRRPNPRAITAAAGLGAGALTLGLTQFALWWVFPHPDMTPLGNTIAGFLYLPLVAWGPLLAAVTVDHHRRRRAAPQESDRPGIALAPSAWHERYGRRAYPASPSPWSGDPEAARQRVSEEQPHAPTGSGAAAPAAVLKPDRCRPPSAAPR